MKISNSSKDITGQKFGKLKAKKRLFSQISTTGRISSMWECKCDCGKIKVVGGARLRSGHTKSCGCLQAESMKKVRRSCNKLPYGEACFNSLYHSYKKNALNAKRQFLLTKEDFKNLTNNNCHYCGAKPASVYKSNYNTGDYSYNGIDRKNNNLGYTLKNSLTCCKDCNLAKRNLDYNDFIDLISKIYNNLKKT